MANKNSQTKSNVVPSSKEGWSRRWIILTVMWVLLLFVVVLIISLWAAGVIFSSENVSAKCEPCSDPIETVAAKTKENYPADSIEHTILSVPTYGENITREEEYSARREQPVIDKLNRDTVIEPALIQTELPHLDRVDQARLDPRGDLSPRELAIRRSEAPGLERFLEHILYINMDADTHKREAVEKQIDTLGLPNFVGRERLSAIKRPNSPLGNFLSHIACLSKALTLKKNVLILEDDFAFSRAAPDIFRSLEAMESFTENRWDVVSFGQRVDHWQLLTEARGVKVCRLLYNTSTSGYLVNKLYTPRLLSFWIQRLRSILKHEVMQEAVFIENVQTDLQKTDTWIGFNLPLGHWGDERWRYLDSLTHATDAQGKAHELKLQDKFVQKRVAVCHVATAKYNQYVPGIQKDCYLKFLKGHHLEFFVFTDEPQNYLSHTEEGGVCHVEAIKSRGYPGDNLYRFHYLLQAEEELKEFDFIYYIDVDYRIYQHPVEGQLMRDGIVATAHLHNVVEKRDGSKRHIGSPEVRVESTACIHPDEKMVTYFSSGFHGGTANAYLTLCHVLRNNINADEDHNITAKWQDESHLNRYLLTYPPVATLSQSYLFSERCLDLECREPMCAALRDGGHHPIMGPASK